MAVDGSKGAAAQLHRFAQLVYGNAGRDGFRFQKHLAAFQLVHHVQNLFPHGAGIQAAAVGFVLIRKGIAGIVRVKRQNVRIRGRAVGRGLQGAQNGIDGAGIRALLSAGKAAGGGLRQLNVLTLFKNAHVGAMANGPCLLQSLGGVEGNAQHCGGNVFIIAVLVPQAHIPTVLLGVHLVPHQLTALGPGFARQINAVYAHIIQKHIGIGAHVALHLPVGAPAPAESAAASCWAFWAQAQSRPWRCGSVCFGTAWAREAAHTTRYFAMRKVGRAAA